MKRKRNPIAGQCVLVIFLYSIALMVLLFPILQFVLFFLGQIWSYFDGFFIFSSGFNLFLYIDFFLFFGFVCLV